jgi:Cu-processing system ATP-binding protein
MERVDIKNVSIRFGSVCALRAVSVSVSAGEVVMLAGPNGAGKSTLLKVILGLLEADTGSVYVDDTPTLIDQAFKQHIGYLPESVAFAEALTGQQVMRFFARARGVHLNEVSATLCRIGLQSASRRAIRGYSRGMRQRLGLGIAILGAPNLLILDEPTGGLDQEGISVFWDVLTEWRSEKRMVLLSSHDLTLLEDRVDRITLLKKGEVIADASPEGLRAGTSLPVRVSIELCEARDELTETLSQSGFIDQQRITPKRLIVYVQPKDLLRVIQISGQHADLISQIRIEEPGFNEIYEHLINEPPISDVHDIEEVS